jgi:hypothetical protein
MSVEHGIAQVQAALAASADLKAIPSNLSPPFADALAEPYALFSNGCLRTYLQVGQPECAAGDIASRTTVALVGDSNALMWAPAFQPVAAQRHWRLETMGKAGCPLMNLPIYSASLHREYTECEQWRGQITARLRADHPRLVVLSIWRRYGASYGWPSGFTSYDSAWITSLNRLVHDLRNNGAKVLVLGPIPDPHSMVPICLSGHIDDATACSPSRSAAVNDAGIAAESAATRAGGGEYADVTELFCTASR